MEFGIKLGLGFWAGENVRNRGFIGVWVLEVFYDGKYGYLGWNRINRTGFISEFILNIFY